MPDETTRKPLSITDGLPPTKSGIAAYADKLKALPATDTYKSQGSGITAGLPTSYLGGSSMSTPKPAMQTIDGNLPAPSAGRPAMATTIGDLSGFKSSATSQPGVFRVTGGGMSPLYTNVGGGEKTVSGIAAGLFDGSPAPKPAPTHPLLAGGVGIAGPSQAAAPATSAINPSYTTGIAGGLPENLQRFANANRIRQEMIDNAPRGGSGVIRDTDTEEWNKKMARQGAIDDMIYEMRKNPQIAGAMSGALAQTVAGDASRDVEGIRQRGITAGLNLQRRGQDLNYGAQMAQQGLAARGQDLNAARDNARLSIDMGRFGAEQSTLQRQQAAQDNLAKAMESGDQSAIARARAMATAAGVKLPEATKLETVQTDSGFMVFNPTSGEMRPAVGAGGQPVGSGKPLTEYQGKSTGFGMRADAASKIIEQVGQDGKIQPSLTKRAAEAVPLVGEGLGMVANAFQSPEQQQVEQAQRDFVNAVLRQESGAAISQSEFDNARKQYFPQPNDSQEVIAQKQANREAAINGFRVSAGPGARNIGNPPAQQQPQRGQQQSAAAPAVGTVDGGYVFLGGNPNDPANWMEARK